MSPGPNDQETIYRCTACNGVGHLRKCSRLCPLNPNYEPETINIAKQTEVLPGRHNLGGMSVECPHCEALLWIGERSEGGVSTAKFQLCCGLGRFTLLPLNLTPPLISNLLKNNDQRSIEFKKHIRSYNNALGFTSMGAKLDTSVLNSRGGAYTFRIHGTIYHRMGSLLPNENERPAFAQIYIFDAENEINNRHSVANHVNVETLAELQSLMHDVCGD